MASTNKQDLIQHFDKVAPNRSVWFYRNYIYHKQVIEVCRPLLTQGCRILELGCSTGNLLNALNPSSGVGVDISPKSIETAKATYPNLCWICADVEALPLDPLLDTPFDIIILSDLMGYLSDIQQTLQKLRRLTYTGSRLIVSIWNWMWQPILRVAEFLQLKTPDLAVRENWLSPRMARNLLELAGYETLQSLPRLLVPYEMPMLSGRFNALSQVPLLRQLTILHVFVARPMDQPLLQPTSVSVVIPTRNEAENIEAAVRRIPQMGTRTELIFVDGNSTDGTVNKIHEQILAFPKYDIKFLPQIPPQMLEANAQPDRMLKLGKGDAVRKGFATASGEIVMILDGDLSVPPEELPKFYEALVAGKARLINGTRFIYLQEDGAMRWVNRLGNAFFSMLFSWLLGQPVTDTLCGTKALFKQDYEAIATNRSYFGDFDPFGDFDLLFGAAWQNYQILDLPIHYHARTYGKSKVRVHSHAPLLLRMSMIAMWRLKIRPLLVERNSLKRNQSIDKH